MRRLVGSTGIIGLGLMTSVAFAMCRSAALSLEIKALLFLSGVCLFIIGGSGYTALKR